MGQVIETRPNALETANLGEATVQCRRTGRQLKLSDACCQFDQALCVQGDCACDVNCSCHHLADAHNKQEE